MKIEFDELPDGFEIRNGQIVEVKQSGGSTGDQKGFGLVTTQTSNVSEDESSVKYSMAPVPRDEANIEAERGETVLTDLNGDGKFGLYDIQGKRHARGGTPLFLPEQSFVYSDFNKMKFTKDEMAQMGIESKKKLTPAKISKKFSINEYYASLKDPYADDIQATTADLMLEKNKMQLSKLSLLQEAKKDYEDGVPVTSYPFLTEQGQDPIEFTQQIENINRQKAEEKYIRSLPFEQQQQIAAMQQYMAQVDQQQQGQQQEAQQQGMLPPAQEQGMQQMPPEMQQMQGMQQGMPPQGMQMPPPPGMNPQQMVQMGFEMQGMKEYNPYDMPYAQGGIEIKEDAPTEFNPESLSRGWNSIKREPDSETAFMDSHKGRDKLVEGLPEPLQVLFYDSAVQENYGAATTYENSVEMLSRNYPEIYNELINSSEFKAAYREAYEKTHEKGHKLYNGHFREMPPTIEDFGDAGYFMWFLEGPKSYNQLDHHSDGVISKVKQGIIKAYQKDPIKYVDNHVKKEFLELGDGSGSGGGWDEGFERYIARGALAKDIITGNEKPLDYYYNTDKNNGAFYTQAMSLKEKTEDGKYKNINLDKEYEEIVNNYPYDLDVISPSSQQLAMPGEIEEEREWDPSVDKLSSVSASKSDPKYTYQTPLQKRAYSTENLPAVGPGQIPIPPSQQQQIRNVQDVEGREKYTYDYSTKYAEDPIKANVEQESALPFLPDYTTSEDVQVPAVEQEEVDTRRLLDSREKLPEMLSEMTREQIDIFSAREKFLKDEYLKKGYTQEQVDKDIYYDVIYPEASYKGNNYDKLYSDDDIFEFTGQKPGGNTPTTNQSPQTEPSEADKDFKKFLKNQGLSKTTHQKEWRELWDEGYGNKEEAIAWHKKKDAMMSQYNEGNLKSKSTDQEDARSILDQPTTPQVVTTETDPPGSKKKRSKDYSSKTEIAFDPNVDDEGIHRKNIGIGERKYRPVQRQKEKGFGDSEENIGGFETGWEKIYPGYEELMKAIDEKSGKGEIKEVGKFQKWHNNDYIPSVVKKYGEQMKAAGKSWAEADETLWVNKLIKEHGFDFDRKGRAIDYKFGTFTSSRRPFEFDPITQEPVVEDYPDAEEYIEPEPDPDPVVEQEDDPINIKPNELKVPYNPNDPRFWLQDLLKLNAIGSRKRKKFYPWQPAVADVDVDYVLEDPTRAIAATNEQMNLMAQGLGSFGGPQSFNSRMANVQGKTAANIANVISGVHNRNINTINRGQAQQSQFDYMIDKENRTRKTKLYDDTMKVEQNALIEENFDREQYADSLASAYSNMANTYNMNTLYDNYNIDPTTGGMMYFTNPKALDPSRSNAQSKMEEYTNFLNTFEQQNRRAPSEAEINYFMGIKGKDNSSRNNYQQEMYNKNNPGFIKGYDYMGKKGKEINKLLPFFVGHVGI